MSDRCVTQILKLLGMGFNLTPQVKGMLEGTYMSSYIPSEHICATGHDLVTS
jgi:hypothetical protein